MADVGPAVEVRGLTEDLDHFDVVLDETDVIALEEHPRLGIAAQTTQPIDRVRQLVALIRRRFPHSEIRFIDTVCHPTKQRQDAAVELARECDVVIVVGGASSNNTRELVNTCSRHCSSVHHVQTECDLDPDWLRVGTDIVGGATPPTFNMTFSLTGVIVPEPSSAMLLGIPAFLALVRRARVR